ncbi:hypothetical protein NC653_022646 [Populus alba x Populus x berolinensis]|uniref:UBC core domain-containing protein n=1 Tax=Populus alba x Populus x berolinensis TaxID=444605 RepID=A0AAD6Q9Y4_9ROSI|nr:hypothetical protein NC653_022646 [Populus alba x Populus x berolinensis]
MNIIRLLSLLLIFLHGNMGGLCQGGVWKIRVELPEAYPYKSPSIVFFNKICHPNIDEMNQDNKCNTLFFFFFFK